MLTLPRVHRLVTISDDEGQDFCSRVEDVEDGQLTVARPLTLPLEHRFEVGNLVYVSWPDPAGLTSATTRLARSHTRGTLGLWELQVVGELHRDQRRQFVRVPALGQIELALVSEESGEKFPHVAGHLLDLSEAALRCALHAEDAGHFPQDADVLTSFALEERQFALPASVLKGERRRNDEDVVELVLSLRVVDPDASALRKLIFAEQLRQRRHTVR
jgi:hypothetical protein